MIHGRDEPANPMIWMLVQIVEFIVAIAVLPRLLPDNISAWLAAIAWVLVIAGAFVLNLRVVMPWIPCAVAIGCRRRRHAAFESSGGLAFGHVVGRQYRSCGGHLTVDET